MLVQGRQRSGLPAARRRSLLWHLSAINVTVLATIVLLLALTPITISAPPRPVEVAILLIGFVVITTANLFLLRRAVAPLNRLTEVMQSIDPREPGRRLSFDGLRDAEVVVLANSFNAMLDRLEVERRQSALRALSAQEHERLRIARELHDEIGQTLTAIALEAERAAEQSDGGEWGRVAGLAQQSVEDLRRIARRLRPEALDDLGLVNAFIALCARMSEHAQIPIVRRLPTGLPDQSPEVALVLYRVAQEALTNVARHAQATQAWVSLDVTDEELVLRVRDDGVGMAPGAESATTNGIAGMRERALLVGGSLHIDSAEGSGTEVTLVVPRSES